MPHHADDNAAVGRALAGATVCDLPVLDRRARAVVVAMDRRVTGVTIYVAIDDSLSLPLDSLRALLRRTWGTPTAPAPSLDSWLSPGYRSYLIVPKDQRTVRRWANIIMLDVAACTAFDQRVHRAGARGVPEAC